MNLAVFVSNREVGFLSQDDPNTGLIDFEYLDGIDDSLAASLLMPPSADPEQYRGYNGLPPPFEISLPEGAVLEAIRARVGKHVNIDDDFQLLRLIGRRTLGRVTFGGPFEAEDSFDRSIAAAARSQNAAERLMEILRERPHMFGISGVMPKMATHLAERGTIVSSAKIVKFDSPDYIGASLVEFACLLACERVGLTVPAIQIAPDASSLSIDRFDMIDGNRIAFEDACALSGLKRTGKYSGSVEHLFDMLDNFLDPGELPDARADLVKLLIMCDVLRNGDAHMKNFGLLYMEDLSRPWLAPVYDVLTTPVWIPKDTPALRTFKDVPAGGEWLDQQSIHQLEEFSQLNGFDAVAFREQCVEVAISTMKEIVPEAPRGRRHDALGRALRIVEAGAELRPPLPPPSVRRRGARTPRAA